jgi:uncharacterized tellurite resistance protein B-like protein
MFFIIFGTRGVNTTAAKGQFCCPACGPASPYRHVRVRRFFTLYFIPLIPLDALGEYVECGTCQNSYKPEVLQFDPDAADREFHAEFEVAVLNVLVRMMLADGHMDPAEIEAIRAIYQKLSGRDIQADEIRSEAAAVRSRNTSVEDYLGSIAGSLNPKGRELVVRAACMVATADGSMDDQELRMLHDVAAALDISDAHFQGILMAVRQRAA